MASQKLSSEIYHVPSLSSGFSQQLSPTYAAALIGALLISPVWITGIPEQIIATSVDEVNIMGVQEERGHINSTD